MERSRERWVILPDGLRPFPGSRVNLTKRQQEQGWDKTP